MKTGIWSSIFISVLLAACAPTGSASQEGVVTETSDQQDAVLYELLGYASKGDIPKLQVLLDGKGKDLINARARGTGESALFRAADFGQVEATKYLMSRGGDPNVANNDGETPLYASSFKGNVAVVSALLEGGAKPDAVESEYGLTPLIVAAWKGHAQVVALLLQRKADIEHAAKDGTTALIRAGRAGHEEVVAMLRAAGAH